MAARPDVSPELVLEALPQLLTTGPPPPPHVIPRFFHAVLTWRPPPSATLQITSSAEMQMSKLRALAALALASTAQPIDVLCSPEAVGSTIAQCMDCMKERDRALKLQALETLAALTQMSHPDCLAFFLPGVTSVLINVIAGDFKHGDAVRGAAVDGLISFLCAALPSTLPAAAPPSPMRIQRTEQWLAKVIAQLGPRLRKCLVPQADAKPKLRLALALNAAKVVLQLPQLASQIFPSLLDAMLFCYDDPLSDLAAAAVEALNSLHIEPSRLGDALRKKLSGLPLLARSSSVDDAAKVVAFRVLLSLTRATAAQPGALEFVLDLHLEDISTSLLPLYGIDERSSALPEVEPTGLEYPRKEYISFHDPKLAAYSRDFVRNLGALGPSMTLVDHYLSYCTSRTMRPAALLIISDLIAGAGARLAVETRAQVRQELHSLDAWEVDPTALFPLSCYAMEALGALVSVSDAEEIKREVLPSFLYLLLEQLGGGQASAAYARVTLTRLARVTDTATTGDLLAANADYLIDEVALRLRSFDAHPGVPSVLLALFRHCPALPFPLLDDTLEFILRALDTQHRRPVATGQLLSVLQALIRLIATSMPQRPVPPPPRLPSPPPAMDSAAKRETTPEEVREFFLKVAEEKEKKKLGVDFDAPATRMPDEEGEGEGELQPSREETALLKCVEKTRHFVSRPETAVAQASLAVQLTALPHLWRMQGAVLPTVFGLWQPLISRIRAADGAPDILQGVLHTVTALVRGAPDFLLPKFNGELLPALTVLLRRYQAADPITAVSELSPAFRLQLTALQCITEVLSSLAAAPSVRPAFDQIGDVCAPYLEATKPAPLQGAAMELFKRIVAADPDALWLQLMTWAGVSPSSPPPGCKQIILTLGTCHPAAENARTLLRAMESEAVGA